jgi:GDPmannose 4,6-dehydratase
MKTALITGITGQDGAYLAEYLLGNNYKVYGAYRRSSSVDFWRIEDLGIEKNPNFFLVEYDLTDISSAIRLIEKSTPDEIYNLAAQSFVGVSFDQPITTAEITGLGAVNILEAIRIVNSNIKFYQASSSEMFGKVVETPQTENTPFYPRSPYGVAKLYAHWMTINYRESHNIFAASGILFNHESPLRGKEFVTRKITDAVAKIHLGISDGFELGNIDAKRDWGYAKDYVKGMHSMLQADVADSFVLATGETYSIRDFVSLAFKCVNKEIHFQGKGLDEVGIDKLSNKRVLSINSKYFRPAEVELLIGNPKKANDQLSWKAKTNLSELVELMVSADINRLKG